LSIAGSISDLSYLEQLGDGDGVGSAGLRGGSWGLYINVSGNKLTGHCSDISNILKKMQRKDQIGTKSFCHITNLSTGYTKCHSDFNLHCDFSTNYNNYG